jgi:hypothetical protein
MPMTHPMFTKRHLFRGRYLIPTDIAKLSGLSYNTVHRRLKRGIPLDAPANSSHAVRHLYGNERLTVREIAAVSGLSSNAVRHRLKHGIPLDGPCKRGREAKQLEFRGRLATVREIVAETGLSRDVVERRTDHVRFYEGAELDAFRAATRKEVFSAQSVPAVTLPASPTTPAPSKTFDQASATGDDSQKKLFDEVA